MPIDLEEEKKKVELQKKKLKLKEALIKEKEKRHKYRRISEIAELAFATNLDQFDNTLLLGAFLEIVKNRHEEKYVAEWKKNAVLFKEAQEKTHVPIAITFEGEPKKEIKNQLKTLKFRWNGLRKEYCGYGNLKEIEILLKNEKSQVEIIND